MFNKYLNILKGLTIFYNKMPTNRTEYMREYYAKHRSHILDTMNVLVECECGCKVRKSLLNKHKRMKKHLLWQNPEEAAPKPDSDEYVIAKLGGLLKKLSTEHKIKLKSFIESELTETKTQILCNM
jgi:hypothetical protein